MSETGGFTSESTSASVRFHARERLRRRFEPVACGLPWPKGAVQSTGELQLIAPDGHPRTLQARVLDRWSDGSVRWCLVDFLAHDVESSEHRIKVISESSSRPRESEIHDNMFPQLVTLGCGSLTIRSHDQVRAEHSAIITIQNQSWAKPVDLALAVSLHSSSPTCVSTFQCQIIECGPLRNRIGFRSPIVLGLQIFGYVDFFSNTPVGRVQLTVRNVQPAGHPGGNWDLGNTGSIFLRDLSVSLRFPGTEGQTQIRCSAECGSEVRVAKESLELYQDSSGGENWKHHTHLNKDRVVPYQFRGYRLTCDGESSEGLRANPIVIAERGGYNLGVAMPDFWQNFPNAIKADASGLKLQLLPEQSNSGHELQGGEQKTHVFYLLFGEDTVTAEPLAWCRSPLVAHADPDWYAASGAIPCLTSADVDPNPVGLKLARQAIEGPDTFFTKRETIDEYGWRNYGDVYADHEAVYHAGPNALVSHYNNQFDVVRGCAIQFLRSADARWWDLLIPAANHTCDIDIYHTDGDKPAYNGGLFWQTMHYNDADTGTHRSYPRSLRGGGFQLPGRDLGVMGQTGQELRSLVASGVGGGPGASHNYNQGLMLAFFLTGNPIYRESAIGLADYVLKLDAPRSIFRVFSNDFTGDATASGTADYQGPGRGSANSILALIVGHRLTGRLEYLEKAEQLIRRVSHPNQDLEELDLLNAELRWFYTMHLQALGEYLDYKAELGQLDRMYDYARLTLLRYARWMAANERPYLDQAVRLQYPNETWVAQELRKVEAFQCAAKHAEGEEKARFLERADWFYRYVERTMIEEFPKTKSLCRPVNLLMNFGWSRAWWQKHPETTAPRPSVPARPEEFGEWRMFVPQKAKAIRRAKRILSVAGVLFVAVAIAILAIASWL